MFDDQNREPIRSDPYWGVSAARTSLKKPILSLKKPFSTIFEN